MPPLQEGARIFLADDDLVFRKQLRGWLESAYAPTRHRILLEAGTVFDALAFIPEQLETQKINAALIDDLFGEEIVGIQIVQAITDSGLPIAMLSCATVLPNYLKIHTGKDCIRIEAALNQMFPPRHKRRRE